MLATFLGTGTSQGIPVIGCNCYACISPDIKDKRTRSSIYIDDKKNKFLIDIGPDFRMQMLSNNLSDLDQILITHEHADHTAGMDDIRPINFKHKKDIILHAEERVIEDISKRFQYIFSGTYPGLPKMQLNTIKEGHNDINGSEVFAFRITHGRLPITGYRIGKLTYITDASLIAEGEIAFLQEDTDTLVINALRREKHPSHFTLDEALQMISIINPRVAYLTHLSHFMGRHEEIQKELPPHVFIAHDNLQISFTT